MWSWQWRNYLAGGDLQVENRARSASAMTRRYDYDVARRGAGACRWRAIRNPVVNADARAKENRARVNGPGET